MKIDYRERRRVSDYGGKPCLLQGIHDGGRGVDQSRIVRMFSEVVRVPKVQRIIWTQVDLQPQDISLGAGIRRPPSSIRA